MSKSYYSEINLHITWHTKDSSPLLTPNVESLTHREIHERIIHTPGVYGHAIGGTETHVHLAITIPPTLAISEFVGQLKGASSHEINERMGMHGKTLQWQAGYGVGSFGTAHLDWVVRYIENQREHHTMGTTIERLERVAPREEEPRRTGLTSTETEC